MILRAGFFMLVLLGGALAVSSTPSPGYMNTDRAAYFLAIQEDILNERFARADSLCTAYRDSLPSDPAGYVFAAGALLGQMTKQEENLYEERFKSLIDSAIQTGDLLVSQTKGKRLAWGRLFLGHARAYRALWESRFGSFMSAIRNGMRSKTEYETGLEADSTVYDLYFGLGSYHYWKSARAGVLRWIGVFRNDKERGIDELYLAADSAVVFADAARQALIWIYLDAKQFDSAAVLATESFEQFPDGDTFLWPLGEALHKSRNYIRALDTYTLLLERLEENPGNYYNIVEVTYRVCEIYETLKRTDDMKSVARSVCDRLDLIPESTRKRQRKHIDYLKRLSRL